MAHYAKVTKHNNIVVNVIVADSDFIATQQEENIEWVQTSYNTIGGVHQLGGTPFRKNFASIGDTWDPDRDAFYRPKPFNSWILNEITCLWEPPFQLPENGQYVWNENTLNWDSSR